ncbi:hypothetical protein BH09BAC6_BH09BAC6_21540 [soil metagenome]
MKIFISIALVLLSATLAGQNVGINQPNPTYPLDVNGNVNVAGNLLVNGTAGAAGQVLSTTTSGATAWLSTGSFPNISAFTQSGTFTVPTGITKIVVEAWGAGGGSPAGGGAAGTYIVSYQTVTPGQVITVTIGTGGASATSNPGAASDGGNTFISGAGPFISLTAPGGKGAFAAAPGYGIRYGVENDIFIQYAGQAGDATTVSYAQKNATTFVIVRKYGDGGAAGPDYRIRSQGQSYTYNESTTVLIDNNFTALAPYPAGGGGGGIFGQAGSNGMVTLRY